MFFVCVAISNLHVFSHSQNNNLKYFSFQNTRFILRLMIFIAYNCNITVNTGQNFSKSHLYAIIRILNNATQSAQTQNRPVFAHFHTQNAHHTHFNIKNAAHRSFHYLYFSTYSTTLFFFHSFLYYYFFFITLHMCARHNTSLYT